MRNKTLVISGRTQKNCGLSRLDPLSVALSRPTSAFPDQSSLSIQCFDDSVPAFIEEELHRLYGSLCSSMQHFRVYGGLAGASTFVLQRGQKIAAIFFFRLDKGHVQVLNEGMPIDTPSVSAFAGYIFGRFKEANAISFTAVESTIQDLGFPFRQFSCTEDTVIELPRTPDEYMNSLGKSTRKNIKQYLNRLQRDYPSFQYQIYDGKEVEESLIHGIIEFNRIRFANKNKVSAIRAEEEQRIVQMVRECGIVGAATIDGKLCAGSITYCIGDHYHSRLRTCNPEFDNYRLGLICGYLMIAECIRRSGKAFHFMAGRESQKTLLLGQHRDQIRMSIFRSNAAMLQYADVLFKHASRNAVRAATRRMLALGQDEGRASDIVRTTIGMFRRIKTFFRPGEVET